jgi:hypothetical protein
VAAGNLQRPGHLGAERLSELAGVLMTDTSVQVRSNRHIAEADVAIVIGPVFPHEARPVSSASAAPFSLSRSPSLSVCRRSSTSHMLPSCRRAVWAAVGSNRSGD